MTAATVYRGSLVRTPDFGETLIQADSLLIVDQGPGGRILEVSAGAEEAEICRKYGVPASEVVRLKEGQFFLPGFIDLHVHAPQYSYHGTATDRPLMDWLDTYTFPRERLHVDPSVAGAEYAQLLHRLAINGTTCALLFGSLHLEACKALIQVALKIGIRVLVGLTCMDRNSPDDYIKTSQQNIDDSSSFVEYVRGMDSSLVEGVITPRFIPTCTPELLQGLGQLVTETGAPVQSHISESMDEVAFATHLHPEVNGRDAQLFDAAKLLTRRCVMAHAVFLADDELQLMAERGSSIAHCPLSNFFFADKLLRVKHCRSLGVKVGLGTDIAGGYSPSMLSAMRNAVIASKALRMQAIQEHLQSGKPGPPDASTTDVDLIGWREALWLATRGGAEALGLQDTIGSLETGKQFDALLVDCTTAEAFDVYPSDTSMDLLEKFATVGDQSNIKGVFIQGRRVR